MFVAIDNTPRDYAWGSLSAIADHRGRTASGRPEAELWLGAHAGSPAKIVDGAVGHADLAGWIAADPVAALGPDLAASGARLPGLWPTRAVLDLRDRTGHGAMDGTEDSSFARN